MINYIKTQKDLLNFDLNSNRITKEEYDAAMFELESAIDYLKKKDRRLTMGFECGFDKIKKYKNFSLEKILNIKHYLDFKKYVEWLNDGNEHSYEEHWNIHYKDDKNIFPGVPDEQDVNDYLSFIGDNDFEENIDFWCSSGREYLDPGILYFDSIDAIDERYIIDKSFIEEAREWLNNKFNDCDLTPAIIKRGFKNISSDLVEGVAWVDIDGIQVKETIDECSKAMLNKDTIVYIPSINFDLDQYETLKSFELFLNELEKVDFNEYYVVYYRSY